MSEKCDQNCESCSAKCDEDTKEKMDFVAQPHELSNVKNIIGVLSGKGGVGKSIVTSMLAVTMKKMGYNIAILDADITGPSIPKIFGVSGRAQGNQQGIFPVKTKTGIDIMSINLVLDKDTDPVIVRGPLISSTVKQFWTDVMWGDIDFMFVDMPPGTGDVPLTVFQSIIVDGIIVVTSPQELVSMIVSKAVRMAEIMNVPVVGLIENMSYFRCPDNGKDYKVFGESHIDEIAENHNLRVLAKLPIDPKISEACDKGDIEFYDSNLMEPVARILEEMGEVR